MILKTNYSFETLKDKNCSSKPEHYSNGPILAQKLSKEADLIGLLLKKRNNCSSTITFKIKRITFNLMEIY